MSRCVVSCRFPIPRYQNTLANIYTAPPRQFIEAHTPPTPHAQRHIPNMFPSPPSSLKSPRTPTKQAGRTHRSSPTTASLTPVTPSTHSFRKPLLPASATIDVSGVAQQSHAGSQASSHTLASSIILRSKRATTAKLHISVSSSRASAINGRKKRKVVDLSSDEEESDYAPPSDDEDDEADSPGAAEAVEEMRKESKIRARKPAPKPVAKKTKLDPAPQSAVPLNRVFSKGKNSFGFYQVPNTLPSAPKRKSQPSTADTSSPKESKSTTSIRSSQRKAKLDAEEKISQLREHDEAFWTQETIVEADEQGKPEAGIVDHVGGRLRDLSITPTPSVAGSLRRETGSKNEDAELLVDVSDAEDAGTKKKASKIPGHDWASWSISLEWR
jgi:hypothetical protein